MDPALIWSYCAVCGGIYLPFGPTDQKIYRDWVKHYG